MIRSHFGLQRNPFDTETLTQPKLSYVPKPKGSWMKLFGRTRNDNLSPDAYRLGAEWRERMNRGVVCCHECD